MDNCYLDEQDLYTTPESKAVFEAFLHKKRLNKDGKVIYLSGNMDFHEFITGDIDD